MKSVATFLMFEGQAAEAVNFYISLFEDGVILDAKYYGDEGPGAPGSVFHMSFSINGQQFMAIDSPAKHQFTFTPAISLYITCPNEAEVDRLFNALSQDGQIFMPLGSYPFSPRYGWCSDRYGVSWQVSVATG